MGSGKETFWGRREEKRGRWRVFFFFFWKGNAGGYFFIFIFIPPPLPKTQLTPPTPKLVPPHKQNPPTRQQPNILRRSSEGARGGSQSELVPTAAEQVEGRFAISMR